MTSSLGCGLKTPMTRMHMMMQRISSMNSIVQLMTKMLSLMAIDRQYLKVKERGAPMAGEPYGALWPVGG
jgi:hypothetical protein